MAKRQLTQAAQAAKAIRQHLKKNGIKCKVTSDNFSMGSSVDVTVYDQLPAAMKEIEAFCEPYEYGTFDAMTDCSGTKNRDFDGPQAKYVHVHNSYSTELQQEAWEYMLARYPGLDILEDAPARYDEYTTYEQNRLFNDVLRKDSEGFWATKKPRVKAA